MATETKTTDKVAPKKEELPSLPTKVAELYETRFVLPGKIRRASGKVIDLRFISLEQAKELAEDEKFPYLVKKKPTSSTATKKAAAEK